MRIALADAGASVEDVLSTRVLVEIEAVAAVLEPRQPALTA
jgi:hypothetical protein